MKPFRLFALTCLASVVVALAPAQTADDIASLRTKAEKGNTLAQYNLGLAYAEGRGVPVDRLEAYVWLSLARERGAHGRALDTLISTLDKASLEMAQQRLADHKGTPSLKIPAVSTQSAEPEIVATIKTGGSSATSTDTTALTTQIATLTADKKQLSEEVAKAWKEIETLNTALKKSEGEIRAASSQASAADQENAAKFNREVEASLNRTNELKSSLEKNLATVQMELDRQTQLNAKLAAVEAARLTPSAEMAALHNQLSSTQTQNSGLTTELAAVRANETKLQDTIAQLEQEKSRLAAVPVRPDLSAKLSELESAAADSTQKLAAANSAQSEAQRLLAESAAALKLATKANEEGTQLRRERDELSNRVTLLAGENTELRTDRQHLQQGLADSGKQVRDSSADASRIKELETQSAALQDSLAEARTQVLSLKSSLAAKPNAPAYADLSGKVRELESALAAVTLQADNATQTLVVANKQTTADLNAAAKQITQLQAALAAKPVALAVPDLSGRVQELETQLAAATTEASRAKQEVAAISKARDADAKNRGPSYPNLAGRVVELQTALADTKRDLADAQTALQTSEQARATLASAAATAPAAEPAATSAEPTEVQKQLAASEDKLATALRGYAMLQREHDAQIEAANKSAEAVATERNSLATQVSALSGEVAQLKSSGVNQTSSAQADAARAAESYAALQRSTAQNATDLAAARALLQQVQGAYTVLANENYQLKTRLSPGSTPSATANIGAATAPAPASGRIHVIAAGDTLSRISQRYYNTPTRWQEIYKANAVKLGANGVLRVGVELVIP